MPRFKQFLQEMIQFDFGIHYVDSSGKDQSVTVKASNQSQAIQKFKGMDSTQGYKNILQVRKGDPVPPNEVNEDLKDEDYKKLVLKHFPSAYIIIKDGRYQIFSQPGGKGLEYLISNSSDENLCWKNAWQGIENLKNKPESNSQEIDDDNSKLIDFIKKKQAERNWSSLGSIEAGQVKKTFEKMLFSSNDIKARIKAKEARTWKELISVIEKAKGKIRFLGGME